MTLRIQCDCGALKGELRRTGGVNRCVCYCSDCQAFAHFLKRDGDVLDDMGGTDIVQTSPDNVVFSEGVEHLACMRLTAKGLLRWYAGCCHTPIGNTHASFKIPMVGLIHNCLSHDRASLDDAVGPIRMRVFTQHAKGEPKPKARGVPAGMLRLAGMMLRARLNGGYRRSPVFVSETGAPIVSPKVLSREELVRVKSGA